MSGHHPWPPPRRAARKVFVAVSRLKLLDAWYEVKHVWHASTAHMSHHTAQHATRQGALDALKGKLEAHHGEEVELVEI